MRTFSNCVAVLVVLLAALLPAAAPAKRKIVQPKPGAIRKGRFDETVTYGRVVQSR